MNPWAVNNFSSRDVFFVFMKFLCKNLRDLKLQSWIRSGKIIERKLKMKTINITSLLLVINFLQKVSKRSLAVSWTKNPLKRWKMFYWIHFWWFVLINTSLASLASQELFIFSFREGFYKVSCSKRQKAFLFAF